MCAPNIAENATKKKHDNFLEPRWFVLDIHINNDMNIDIHIIINMNNSFGMGNHFQVLRMSGE